MSDEDGVAGGRVADGAVARAAEAVRAGRPVLLPADGVYGLCAWAASEEAVRGLYRLKGRDGAQPTALMAASVDTLLALIPELHGRSELIVRALLPGPYTLVLANPERRFAWLNGARPETIGVRVAELPASTQRLLDLVGAVAATSANAAGEPAAASLEDVPERIRSGCGAEIDEGRLSGQPSTVIDLSGAEPVVLREGRGRSAEALDRVRRALAASGVVGPPGPG